MFYDTLKKNRGDDTELSNCIERVVAELNIVSTTGDRPGMLLGKIQSGKTRGFVGVIARSFDADFEIAIVLTKGTKTLSAQTVARLNDDFASFIEDDKLIVFDIMQIPGKLTKSELKRKLVIVAKKETNNLKRVIDFFEIQFSDQKNRRILLVDDEADLASVRFVQKRGNPDVEQGTIAEQIDHLRRICPNITFLQVTATPYSLYLQPEEYEKSNDLNCIFKPKKPAFTEILPIHSKYVGGDDFFGYHGENDPRHYLIVEVPKDEQDALRKPDQRRIKPERILESQNVKGLLQAIISFVLGACIRRWQQEQGGEKRKKYAMIIHNDTMKSAHSWQDQVIEWIFEAIIDAAVNDPNKLEALFDAAYLNLSKSVIADGGKMPDTKVAFADFIEAFRNDEVVRETVNSDKDVMALLDSKAELRLRTPYNIFLGGNILDRGITIPNLLSFYYGRNPKTMQADTVLQHSRMYGARDRRDLAVTRFYTSRDVFDRLYTINEFENALREAFLSGAHDKGVVFIRTDEARKVRPCAPNKILLSDIVAIKPAGIYLPTSFHTVSATDLKKAEKSIAQLIPSECIDSREFSEVDEETAISLIQKIRETIKFDSSSFDWDAMISLIKYYSELRDESDGKVLILAETGRKLSREKSGDKSGISIIGGPDLRQMITNPARAKPALVLLQQVGTKELGWSGHPFWWPMLAAPSNAEPCIFSNKVSA
jgi:hypothetical protein